MKRVVIFIGLKVVEIGGSAIVLIASGRIMEWYRGYYFHRWSFDWWLEAIGGVLISIGIGMVIVIFCGGIVLLIKNNWEKAGELSGVKKEKS